MNRFAAEPDRHTRTERKHGIATIVLAYELSVCGVSWKLIERELGDGLHMAVRDAKRHGIYR